MKPRFLPASTFGQTALLMAAALAIAQLIGFFVLVSERQRASLVESAGPAVARFADLAGALAPLDPPARRAHLAGQRRTERRFFDRRYAMAEHSVVTRFALPRDANLEQRLSRALVRAGVPAKVEASNRAPPGRMQMMLRRRLEQGQPPPGGPPPQAFSEELRGPPPADGRARGPRFDTFTLSAQFADGDWLNAVYRIPRAPRDFLWRLAATALVLYVAVLAAALLIAYRLSRPLRTLAQAADTFGVAGRIAPLPERGPADVRAAIAAFNAMAARVTGLLEEKDRMLGAIGHDLRTPLASLRIRAENMEPATERERAIETLEEMRRILEDILDLARLGRSSEPARLIDISALADSLVEECRALGQEATFAESPRAPVLCQRLMTTRLIRNLIENAVKFGTRARVSVTQDAAGVTLCVEDDGPGIPEADLERVGGAFVRLETSRNRETGGAGLGLSIAHAIAASQNAKLELSNRPEGGLAARVRWANV